MTRLLIAFLLPILLGSSTAFANCEADLITEFVRVPDDSDNGRVTDQVKISVEALKASYARAIFPWEMTAAGNAVWFSPPERGILEIQRNFRIPHAGDRKAVRKLIERGQYEVRFDTDFRQVITECARQTRADGYWISDAHIEGYVKLHEAGLAHSAEVWEGDKMVGGLYGTFVNGYFSGESMFHKANDVTKLAYASLIERLAAGGHTFIDTQQVVGLNEKWGAKYIPRDVFKRMIKKTKADDRPF